MKNTYFDMILAATVGIVGLVAVVLINRDQMESRKELFKGLSQLKHIL